MDAQEKHWATDWDFMTFQGGGLISHHWVDLSGTRCQIKHPLLCGKSKTYIKINRKHYFLNQIWYFAISWSRHVISLALIHPSVLQHPMNTLYIFLQFPDRPQIHPKHMIHNDPFNTMSWLQGLQIFIHTMLIVFCAVDRYYKICAFIYLDSW